MIPRLPLRVVAAVGALALVAGCNLPPPASDPEARAEYFETNDPLEPVNRVTHTFNQAVDTMLLRPAAEAYRIFIPQPIRTGLGNFLDNLLLPRTTVYNALQGNSDRAADSFSRFAINSTLGVFGIFDFASDMGFPPQYEDMGQNLAVWAGTLDGGPYIVLPILGPSNVRDTTGRIIDFFTDPWQWLGQGDTVEALRIARVVAQAIDTREGLIEPLDALKAQSLDYYAAIRSLYRQQRDRDIQNQSVGQRRYFDWTGERQGLPQ
ncbi:MlaA family lipoprotein [Elioraea rosea]|uniref:MlaA family lipoprotein n=1 Tax=Elioraea rosea TaxID=2492390 RepID=UPI001315AD9A|nr:VacJ family lipoprotein [Elioraea rosea]